MSSQGFRWAGPHGEPTTAMEAWAQAIWRHRVAVYLITVATATLVVSLFTLFGVAL